MAVSFAPLSLSGGSHLKTNNLWYPKSNSFRKSPALLVQKKSTKVGTNLSLSVRADLSDGNRSGGGDFVAGFLLGGAIFGTLAYVYAPQIRRILLNEDEHGFRKARRPIYYEYDDGLESTRQTLNAKISQLNNAIDKVSSRLRGKKAPPAVPVENDPEVEATI